MPQTTLYRHYNENYELLYVGISKNAIGRLGQHELNSHWANEIREVRIQHFETRQEAEAAERKAILDEHPLHNVAHNVRPGRITPPDDFDATWYDKQGFPHLAAIVHDADGMKMKVEFEGELPIKVHTKDANFIELDVDILDFLYELSTEAELWMEKWNQTAEAKLTIDKAVSQ